MLAIGIAGRNLADGNRAIANRWNSLPDGAGGANDVCREPNPNAIIRLQRVNDMPISMAPCGITELADVITAVSQDEHDYWPNALYDTREGSMRDANPVGSTDLALSGVMHYVELDVNNLATVARRAACPGRRANGANAKNETTATSSISPIGAATRAMRRRQGDGGVRQRGHRQPGNDCGRTEQCPRRRRRRQRQRHPGALRPSRAQQPWRHVGGGVPGQLPQSDADWSDRRRWHTGDPGADQRQHWSCGGRWLRRRSAAGSRQDADRPRQQHPLLPPRAEAGERRDRWRCQ